MATSLSRGDVVWVGDDGKEGEEEEEEQKYPKLFPSTSGDSS